MVARRPLKLGLESILGSPLKLRPEANLPKLLKPRTRANLGKLQRFQRKKLRPRRARVNLRKLQPRPKEPRARQRKPRRRPMRIRRWRLFNLRTLASRGSLIVLLHLNRLSNSKRVFKQRPRKSQPPSATLKTRDSHKSST